MVGRSKAASIAGASILYRVANGAPRPAFMTAMSWAQSAWTGTTALLVCLGRTHRGGARAPPRRRRRNRRVRAGARPGARTCTPWTCASWTGPPWTGPIETCIHACAFLIRNAVRRPGPARALFVRRRYGARYVCISPGKQPQNAAASISVPACGERAANAQGGLTSREREAHTARSGTSLLPRSPPGTRGLRRSARVRAAAFFAFNVRRSEYPDVRHAVGQAERRL